MKYILTFLIFITFCKISLAQSYQINYIQTTVKDSAKTFSSAKKVEYSTWTLVGNTDTSVYFTQGKDYSLLTPGREDSLLNAVKDSIINKDPRSGNTVMVDLSNVQNHFIAIDSAAKYVFIDKKNNLVRTRDFFNKTYLITQEQIPGINWEISKEFKYILSYEVYKARANFRGRNYTAWFTNKIPVLSGPWKFGGLPGLILELYSDDEQVKFIASEIKIPAPVCIPVNLKTTGINLTLPDYFNYLKTYYKKAIQNSRYLISNVEDISQTKPNNERYRAVINRQEKTIEILSILSQSSYFIEKRF
ncbi:MAG: GLPGLI family protein [Niastella sp.]|nr:GLPGLI family protein [Niastella sp.]